MGSVYNIGKSVASVAGMQTLGCVKYEQTGLIKIGQRCLPLRDALVIWTVSKAQANVVRWVPEARSQDLKTSWSIDLFLNGNAQRRFYEDYLMMYLLFCEVFAVTTNRM